jgi:NitT/TauT family transport system ATP-binding protein
MPITAEARVRESRPSPGPLAVEVTGAAVTYRPRGREPVAALSDMDLRVPAGQVVGVVGPSGCGKSTLLELVCGLREPDAGEASAEPAVLMPQRDLLLPWLSAIDNAALALTLGGAGRAEARAAARPLFERFGLAGFEGGRPAELSGGMRQRVAFLRTLLSGKPVLALDEPFAGLDALTRREMQDWLAEALAIEPRTVVLVTHDVEEAVVLSDRVIVMGPRPGRAVADLAVEAERPRRRGDPTLVELRERASRALGVDR